MNTDNSKPDSKIYFVIFEEYLQPRKPQKLQSFVVKSQNENRTSHLQLLENPILNTQSHTSQRWRSCFERIKQKVFLNRSSKAAKNKKTPPRVQNELQSKLVRFNFRLPKFLSFLYPPDDDGLCRRKTGFEIYCEMASIHGFKNFIDGRLWQRLFWIFTIFLATLMAFLLIAIAVIQKVGKPTIFYTEGITDPTWPIRQPAVTICNLNRISQQEALKVADKFLPYSSLPRHEILRLFRLTLYASQDVNGTAKDFQALEVLLERNNYTITNLLREISPKCEQEEFKLCKQRGHHERCQRIFEEVFTSFGVCCSTNFWAYKEVGNSLGPEFTTSCGYYTGLSVFMRPNVENYNFSMHKFVGYEVYIHDTMDIPNEFTEKQIISSSKETSISVTPRSAYGTYYLRSKSIEVRRCYFPDEHKLINFRFYSLPNCLAECRSRKMHAKCNCLPPFWPKIKENWKFCQTATQINCTLSNRDTFSQMVVNSSKSHTSDHAEFECGCLPLCTYNQYTSSVESTPLDRNFSIVDRRLFKGVRNIRNYLLLHVFYADLITEKFRYDVVENWLSAMGLIGGIAGLHMGFSVISILELIFFVFVRPLSNVLTKQQIRYERMRNRKKEKTEKEEEQKT